MCGLLGVYGPQHRSLTDRFKPALDTMTHRGPDDHGFEHFESESLALGHRRLSILDLTSAGHQPMKNGSDWIVFNGEIYNHLELRAKYLSDVQFSSTSDTETLLKLLKKNDLMAFSLLKGMFAGAWYNSEKKELVIFRDSLGIKPLYYQHLADSTLCFASEIKSLWVLNSTSQNLCSDTLNTYLTFENYPQGQNLFHDVDNLLPGEIHVYSIDSGKVIKNDSRFIVPPHTPYSAPNSDIELAAAIEQQILKSVRMHLISDVPLGVYLSGGIDSSLIAMMASKETKNTLAFTGYFKTKDSHYDERNYSRQVAKAANLELSEIEIKPEHFLSDFDKVIYHLDQPRMGMGSFSQFIVAKEAARHRKVILAGHGGDELFAGYPLHKSIWLLSTGLTNPQSWSSLRSLKSKEWPWLFYTMGKKFLGKPIPFTPKVWRDRTTPTAFSNPFLSSENLLTDLDRYYKDTYIPGLLDVEDRISMAHSLETRVPLWSQELVSFASQIPMKRKIKNGELKYLLKMVAAKWLPKDVLQAPKRGFPTPLRLWFRQELHNFVEERLLNSSNPLFYDIISHESLLSLVKSHKNTKLPYALDELRAHKIWTALCVESWLRQYKICDRKEIL